MLAEILEEKENNRGRLFVPKRARWNNGSVDEEDYFRPALRDLKGNIGGYLNKALAAIKEENDVLAGVFKENIDFDLVWGKSRMTNQKLGELLNHFNKPAYVLVNDNFEFSDLLGAAHEKLIKSCRVGRIGH